MDYRIMIAGGRDFADYKLLKESLDNILKKRKINKSEYNIIVVSGKAKGADTLGEKYALENKFKIEGYAAKWNDLNAVPCKIKVNPYGKSYNCLAGMNRNKDMVEVSDLIVLFHDGVSKGTMDDLNLAKKYNKDLEYIKY